MQTIILVKSLNEELVKRAQDALEMTRVIGHFQIDKAQVVIEGGVDEATVARRVLLEVGCELL